MVLRDELVAEVAKESGLNRQRSAALVTTVLDALQARAEAGPVEISTAGSRVAWLVAGAAHAPIDVMATLRDVIRLVPEIVAARRARLAESRIETLVDVLVPDEPAGATMRAIETDNARERARFIHTVPTLGSKELAAMAGHGAANVSVTGSRWKKQGKVFSLPWRGGELYPAFQFRDGRPHPSVKAVLAALPAMTPWQVAFWFTSANGWLDGRTPAEALDDAEAVLAAATHQAEPLIG